MQNVVQTEYLFVQQSAGARCLLSASLEGQAPVTATINSTDDLNMTGGLTTKMQRTFAQGDVAQVIQQTVPSH